MSEKIVMTRIGTRLIFEGKTYDCWVDAMGDATQDHALHAKAHAVFAEKFADELGVPVEDRDSDWLARVQVRVIPFSSDEIIGDGLGDG